MIKEIILDGHAIKYQITFKNNKNTYFYFKRKGYIQINASRYQTHKSIFKFINDNKQSFIDKYHKTEIIDNGNVYFLFGVPYTKELSNEIKNIQFDHTNFLVKEPNLEADQLDLQYKNFEKKILLEKLNKLKETYLSNGHININDISFKTRYMETRFGSCNPLKKTININLYLVNLDEKYLEYVFLHEISHLNYHNHSKEYYSLLSKLSNNYKQLRKELNYKFNHR